MYSDVDIEEIQVDYNSTAANKENMGRGVSLTKEEKRKITVLSLVKASTREIAGAVVESKNAVQNYSKSPAAHEVEKVRVYLER